MGMVKRFEIYLVDLNSTRGREIFNVWPTRVLSSDEMNRHLQTVIIAPMTTKTRDFPSRVQCEFAGKTGQIALDQIRSIDKTRLVKKMGKIDVVFGRRV